jgi:hypothetical protein
MVVDVVGRQDTDDPVMEEDEADGGEEGPPVLVEGDHTDHDEEVEVGLDHPARQVHEHRRRGHEAEGSADGARGAPAGAAVGAHRQAGDGKDLDQTMAPAVAPGDGEDEKGGDVEGQKAEDAAVP